MNIYEVTFKFLIEIDPDELPDDVDEEEFENGVREVNGYVHVCADCMNCAFSEAEKYLLPRLEDMDYEILSISKLEDLRIVNFPGENEEEFTFNCAFCKEEISAPNDEWDSIECPKCKNKILRDRVIEIGQGKYMMVSVKDDAEKKED